jgi:predicted membrane-bound dolichyl-phosphate-mannose-protein mannosyltransferase
MNKTATIYSKNEALMMAPKDRPICYRVPSKIYHDVWEHIGAASVSNTPEEAEKLAVELLFKIADVLEQMDMTYGEWPDSFKGE